jgi:DNA-binding transcriptional LysR family regulator
MPAAVAQMRARHPGITVVIKDALAERIIGLIRADEVDLALTSAPPTIRIAVHRIAYGSDGRAAERPSAG